MSVIVNYGLLAPLHRAAEVPQSRGGRGGGGTGKERNWWRGLCVHKDYTSVEGDVW